MKRTAWLVTLLLANAACAGDVRWKSLGEGLEYATLPLAPDSAVGDPTLHIVRVDPSRVSLKLALASENRGKRHTAAQWCREKRFRVAINAGMFAQDGIANVGYLRDGVHLNDAHWKKAYHSVLALGPSQENVPTAKLVDVDDADDATRFADYRSVVQNLRLIKGDGVGVWKQSDRRWSEAMVATDGEGRVLFLFTRLGLSMHELNTQVLAAPLGIVRAMHVEGGPEASLSIHAGGVNLDLAGSFETGFFALDTNDHQWDLPNVLGVGPP